MRYIVMLAALAAAGGTLAACASAKGATERPTLQDNVRIVGTDGISTLSSVSAESPEIATVLSPVDSVWRALPAVFETLTIPVATFDASTRTIGNPNIKVRRRLGTIPLSRYLDCGDTQGTPSADSYEVHMSVVTRVQPAPAGAASTASTVVTTVEASARPVSFAGDFIRCSSTGALEARLATLIGVELRK
ncbi:MAG TPA: hypothetical protein VKA84_20090 [Gemmatimonadaceae bacterium]|nr:hypothetical protein [Gemmatimonadaceae bacterium]